MAHYSADATIYAGGGFTVRVNPHDVATITHPRWPGPHTVPGEFACSMIIGNTLYVMHINRPKTHVQQISKFTHAGPRGVIWCDVLTEYDQTVHGDIYQFPQGSIAITAGEIPVITARLRNYTYGDRLYSYDVKTTAYHWRPPPNTFIACDICRVHIVTVDGPWQPIAQFNHPRLERHNILLKRQRGYIKHTLWESELWKTYLGNYYVGSIRTRGETIVPPDVTAPIEIQLSEILTLTTQYTPWLWQLFTDRETYFADTPDDILRMIGEFIQERTAVITGNSVHDVVNLDDIY